MGHPIFCGCRQNAAILRSGQNGCVEELCWDEFFRDGFDVGDDGGLRTLDSSDFCFSFVELLFTAREFGFAACEIAGLPVDKLLAAAAVGRRQFGFGR